MTSKIEAERILASGSQTVLKFFTKGGGATTERLRIWNSGNVLIQDGGTFTDAGFRLDVNGTARVQGVTTITGSTMAASAIARGANLTSTLVAAANNDVLVGLDVNPTFTNGAFTGVSNIPIRVGTSSTTPFGSPLIFMGRDQNAESNFQISNSTDGSSAAVGFRIFGANLRSATIQEFSQSHSTTEFASHLVIESNNPNAKHGIILSLPSSTAGSDLMVYTAGRLATNRRLTLFNSTGNLLLQSGGTHSDAGFRLDVNGTARVQGNLTASFVFGGGNNSTTIYADAPIASGVVIQRSNRGATATSPIVIFTHDTLGEQARLLSNGLLALGTNSPNASAILDITSTTRGFLPPRMTTTQRNAIASPATGLVVYDTTLNKLAVYTGAAWETITSV
jgi:hypothetical protein